MRLRRRQAPAEDFQMAPMIDMVFLLLVFFMCVSSLSRAERAVPVELPTSTESEVPEELANRVSLTVSEEGVWFLGGRAVDARGLAGAMREAVRANPQVRLHVRAAALARFEDVRRLLRICADAGAYEVIYATHQEN